MDNQEAIKWLREAEILDLASGNTKDREAVNMAISALHEQDVPDINVGNCPYCHEDSDGFVFPIEKNGHACVLHDVDGWVISLKAKGWRGSCHIKFCPMCGRRLKHG